METIAKSGFQFSEKIQLISFHLFRHVTQKLPVSNFLKTSLMLSPDILKLDYLLLKDTATTFLFLATIFCPDSSRGFFYDQSSN